MNLDGSHDFIYLDEGNNNNKIAPRDKNVFPRDTKQHKPVHLIREGSIEKRSHDLLIMEGLIEGRSRDVTDQDGKIHIYKTRNYYIIEDESKEGAIRENDINQIENEEYYSTQADIKKVIEKEGKIREQTSRLGIEVFESEEQCNGSYLSSIEPRKEKPSVPIVQSKDNAFNKQMNDSDEDDINLAKAIEQ